MKKNITLFFILLIILSTALVSCSSNGPEKTVREFLDAQVENDIVTMTNLIDPNYQEDIYNFSVFSVGLSVLVGGAESEYKDLHIKTVSQDSNRAVVNVTGKLTLKAFGTPISTPINDNLDLIKIDGKWYITF